VSVSPFTELRALEKAERYLAGVEAALVTDNNEPGSEIFKSRNVAVRRGPWISFSHDRALCHHCKHRFDDTETVFIAKQPYSPGHPIWRRFPLCGPCAKRLSGNHWFSTPKPCGYCERTIAVSDYAKNRRRPDFCCDLCASREANRVARDIRREMRDNRTCKQCRTNFESTRADASFCSSACRQRAYRERSAVTGHLQ
jgi:hypothetical protein